MPIPVVGRRRSVITGPDEHTPAQVTTSSPTTQRESIANSSFGAVRRRLPTTFDGGHAILAPSPILLTTSSAFRKKMDHCCRKETRIPEFRSVISATPAPPTPAEVLPGHFHHTATPTPEPRRLPATDQPSRRAPQPLSKRSHPRRISASQTPAGPCPHTPGNHLCGTEFGPSPAGGPKPFITARSRA
jgi:hypothetical protein